MSRSNARTRRGDTSAVPIADGGVGDAMFGVSQTFQRCLTDFFGCAARSAGFSLVVLTAAQAADPDRIEMRIEIYGVAGVHVATNHTIVEEALERYAITTDVASRGIATVLYDLTSHSEVRGRLTGDTARPQAYLGEVRRSGTVDRNRVEYATDGAVTGLSEPPAETHTPVGPALMRGTVDQLTAFFMIERQLALRGSCARVVAVFDGRRRYDLHFTDVAPEVLPAADRSFAGATQVCHLRREAIAGFRDDSGRSEGAYEGTLWFARLLPGDLMIPVQTEFSTEFGTVTGHLAELHGRGVHLRYAKWDSRETQ
jgi:Protein of unknown function (DUF3108)